MAEPELDVVSWALKALRDEDRLGGYRVARRYFEGDHRLTFATDKFKETFASQFGAVRDNLCPAVVEAKADRLVITGVESDADVQGATPELAAQAWAIWQRNRMDVRAPEVHHEALLTGDGFVLVWPNQAGESVLWPIPADEIVVEYDPNVPGALLRAARTWQDDEGFVHLDIYLPERVERRRTKTPKRKPMSASWTWKDFEPWSVTDADLEPVGVLTHDAGQVPVVHFPNGRYHGSGMSELKDVIPLQDALNKTICDMLIAQEFSAYPQRWATGIDPGPLDPKTGKPISPPFDYGADRMLTAMGAEGAEAKFGAFPTSELEQYVTAMENHRAEIARVSGTPLHYLFITRGDFPSGEAMKSAEARFTRKVKHLQQAWGNQWEDVLALATRLETTGSKADGAMLTVQWEEAAPTVSDTGQPVAAAPPDADPDDSRARSAAQPA